MRAYIADESPKWNGDPQESIAHLSAQGWGLPFLRRAFAS